MIVLDASALVELLLNTETGERVAKRIVDPSLGLHIPHLADLEVVQALRQYEREPEIDEQAAADALEDLRSLDLHVMRTSRSSIESGSFDETSAPTMPSIWPSRRSSTPCY